MYDSEMKNPPKIKNNKLPRTFPVDVRIDVAFIMIGGVPHPPSGL